MGLDFRILGPLEVHRDDEVLSLGPPKQRALLAILLLNPGRPVSADLLADLLWGEELPDSSANLIQGYVSGLRKALGGGDGPLGTVKPGYVLRASAEDIDAGRFESMTSSARARMAEDPEEARSVLKEALELWRGPALADFTFDSFAQSEIGRLEAMHQLAVEDRIQCDLALGHHAEAVGELEKLVAAHPVRERLRGLLMLALFRSGRQAEALAVYREGRQALADELGIDPGLPLQRLEQQILRQDPVLYDGDPGALVAGAGAAVQAMTPGASDGEATLEENAVTILSAAAAGFAELKDKLDPREFRHVAGRYFDGMRREIERRGGAVERFVGETLVASFGERQRHEDDPRRAVESALGMLQVHRARSEGLGAPVDLRIGIDTASPARSGRTAASETAATRLRQAAGPGALMVSESTWRAVREDFEGHHLGPLEMDDGDRVVEAYRLTGPRPMVPRREAAFVGRADERALLSLLWSSAAKGNTHVVSLVGEPGVGKSRLLSEFAVHGALEVRVACSGELAFGPLLEVLYGILGEAPPDAGRLRQLLDDAGVGEEVAPLLAALLGMGESPPVVLMADEQRREQVFAGVWQFLLEAIHDRPTLIVLDDLQLSDRSTMDLLAFLLKHLTGVPLLLVLASRPGFRPAVPEAVRSSRTDIRLEPLSVDDSLRVAAGFLQVSELPANLEQLVIARAEGNPFFVEELLQALIELGALTVHDDRASLSEGAAHVPHTIEGTILARIDRLDARLRHALQAGSVLGRSFTRELLEAVVDDRDLGAVLEELGHGQLIVNEGPGRWTFKHALIQEVTYASIPAATRREMHATVARALERRTSDDPLSLEMLAEHYDKADLPEKSRFYALAAGDTASRRMGFVEARDRYQMALRLWGQGDEEGRLELLTKLGFAALVSGDPGTARTMFIEAESGWRSLGRTLEAGAALAMLGRSYFFGGEAAMASDALMQAIDLLEPAGPSEDLGRAFAWLTSMLIVSAQSDEGADLARRGLAALEGTAGTDLDIVRSSLMTSLGMFEVLHGDPSGTDRIRDALVLAERASDVEAAARAYVNLSLSLAELLDVVEGTTVSYEGREAMRRLGAPSFEWVLAALEASMLVEVGRFDEAEHLCREILGPRRSLLISPGITVAGTTLALACIRTGRFREARATLQEVLPSVRRGQMALFLYRALGVEAELEEAEGNVAAARLAITEGVRVALETPSVTPCARLLVTATRLVPDQAAALRERVEPHAKDHVSIGVALTESAAIVDGDASLFAEAAAMYDAMSLPYQAARCWAAAGDVERADQLTTRFGLEPGPLGDANRRPPRPSR
ncbi:MAG TPA: BTAD domain-containing putative transcriptional regulator [Actinomycetota bacterium]